MKDSLALHPQRFFLCRFAAALSLGLFYCIPALAADWSIVDLGTLGKMHSSWATDINSRGYVIGGNHYSNMDDYRGFLHDGLTMREIPTFGGCCSTAYGINDRGQVVGYSQTAGDTAYLAFLYEGTTMSSLGTLGGPRSAATDINNSGQITGGSSPYPDQPNVTHAFLYDGATMRDLGTLGSGDFPTSAARGINATGKVVGWTEPINLAMHGFLYDGTTMNDIGAWIPARINARGQIIGQQFLYNGTTMQVLTLGGSYSEAYGINDRGQVVGMATTSSGAFHAFLYDGGMRDIGLLPEVISAGWIALEKAQGINESGQIAGQGRIGSSGNTESHAFLLHPQTTSRYMKTVDGITHFNLGCAQTQQSGLLILDYGQPSYNGTDYGTIFPGTKSPFIPISDIEYAVKLFLNGYYTCGGRGFLTVAVGTNNFGSKVSPEHGQAWGQMMVRLNAYISNPGADLRDRLAVVGASDIEVGWNPPGLSRAWVDAYASTSQGIRYYNYGDAQGCPTTGTGPCDLGWTQEDIWYVSWGSAANPLPVPEIYFNAPPGPPSNARQWVTLAALHGGAPMFIPGVLTQWQACQDPGRKCDRGYNTPIQAWRQTMDALYAVTPDPNTGQNVLFSSDITWQN